MKSLQGASFPGDTGQADQRLAEALGCYAQDLSVEPVLAAMCRARLLLPVVASAGAVEVEMGSLLTVDRTADIAVVFMQRGDGRKALMAFTSLDAISRWDAQARPVPVSARDAARAAVTDGADALLVDVAGPARCVVETTELRHLAAGHVMVATSHGYVWLAEG